MGVPRARTRPSTAACSAAARRPGTPALPAFSWAQLTGGCSGQGASVNAQGRRKGGCSGRAQEWVLRAGLKGGRGKEKCSMNAAQGRAQGWVGGAGVDAQGTTAQTYILGQFWVVRAGLLLKAARARALIFDPCPCAVMLYSNTRAPCLPCRRHWCLSASASCAACASRRRRTVQSVPPCGGVRSTSTASIGRQGGCGTGRGTAPVGQGLAWHIGL